MILNEGLYLENDMVVFVFPLYSKYETDILDRLPQDFETLCMEIVYK